MRSAIRDIQKEVGITTVYVTHDQEEALAVSDRIAVMNLGELQQVGTPFELYHRPANLFVAGFVGSSTVFDAVCKKENGKTILVIDGQLFVEMKNLDASVKDGEALKVTVRPEEFRLEKDQGQANVLRGRVKSCIFLGKFLNYEIMLSDGTVIEISQPTGGMDRYFPEGEKVALSVDAHRINAFDQEGTKNLIRGEA